MIKDGFVGSVGFVGVVDKSLLCTYQKPVTILSVTLIKKYCFLILVCIFYLHNCSLSLLIISYKILCILGDP